MLGAQDRVALGEPSGGPVVQFAAPGAQERAVDTVADQRVAEHERGSVGAQEPRAEQRRRVVARVARQMAQGIQRETLAEDRGGLQRRPVGRGQAIDAGQHQALDAAGNLIAGEIVGVVQELHEEQRVSLGTRDAVVDQRHVRPGDGARQVRRLVPAERAEVQRGQRRRAEAGAPGRRQRIAVQPRGRHQHGRQ